MPDGSTRTGRIPDRDADRPRLLYHRRFMMSEKIAALVPPADAAADVRDRARRDWLPLVKGVAGHLLRSRQEDCSVTLAAVEHYLPDPEELISAAATTDAVTPLRDVRLGGRMAACPSARRLQGRTVATASAVAAAGWQTGLVRAGTRFGSRPSDPLPLAVIRIATGAILAWSASSGCSMPTAFFGADGWMRPDEVWRMNDQPWQWSWYFAGSSPTVIRALAGLLWWPRSCSRSAWPRRGRGRLARRTRQRRQPGAAQRLRPRRHAGHAAHRARRSVPAGDCSRSIGCSPVRSGAGQRRRRRRCRPPSPCG